MGEVASRAADLVVLTSDNPRSESPEAIIADIERGLVASCETAIESDRRAAIQLAIGRAQAGDVVLIAGKGHETVQIVGAESFPFDDRVVAREALQ